MHTRMNPESPPLSWKILLTGYVPDYLYDLGRIDTTKPFAELEKLSQVNARAHAAAVQDRSEDHGCSLARDSTPCGGHGMIREKGTIYVLEEVDLTGANGVNGEYF